MVHIDIHSNARVLRHYLRRFAACAVVASSFTVSSLCAVYAEELPRVVDAKGPRPDDRAIARAVKKLVEDEHISKRKFDDELSERAFDHFLKSLDPQKLFFLKPDIDEFAAFRTRLDDLAQKGDVSFAYTAYKRELQRIQELMPVVHELIDQQHDFTIDEKIVTDRDLIEYPANMEEAKERWRKQIKYSLLILKADKKTDEQARDQLHRRYRTLEKTRSKMDVYELLELYLSSLTESLDPHTNYMAPRAKENFDIQLKLQLFGIGAQLKYEDGNTVISGVVPGGAAAKDGRLQEGDKIISVGQEGKPEMVEVMDMKLDDVVSLIRGPAGSKVRLGVQPKIGSETKVIEIVRAKIELADSAARGQILDRGVRADGMPYKVGYIELPSFYLDMEAARKNVPNFRSTTADMRAILEKFKASNVDAVVLDLTKNGGGSLPEAVSCTGLFIDRGPVVQVKGSDGDVMMYEDEEKGVAWDGPLVVMTSKFSASASEIFAGAIKDYNRGIVVGDPTTHGKGTVQTLLDVGDFYFGNASKQYGALKLTIQQFYLPNGHSTQREGVTADVILPSISANMDVGEADLDFALPADKVTSRPHSEYRMVDNAIRAELTQRSIERVAKSTEFDKLNRRIEAYKRQKDEKYAALDEVSFMARRAEFDAEKEEEGLFEDKTKNKEKVYNDSFYNEEVMSVTVDYINALRQRKMAKAG